MATASLDIHTFVSADFGQNAYLVVCPGGSALIIDPGGQAGELVARLDAEELTLAAVLLTHAHLDHIEGVARIVHARPAPLYLHPDDAALYSGVMQQAALFGLKAEPQPPPDHGLEDGQTLDFDGCALEVRHVPGHSPGHVLFYAAAAEVAFVGDVVFQGSIGRTDLPGGSYQTLMRSIREKVLTLPPETTLLSGHGPPTTVAHEARSNPFLIPH
ncbi:MAG: MBL fold metallo-hydrolase, partial [Longimicrobiales bacterium]